MHNREFKFGYQHFLLCQKSFLKVSSKWLLKNKSGNGKLLLGKTYSDERFRAILALLFPKVSPGYKIIETLRNLVYLPLTLDIIDSLGVSITDQDDHLLNLRNEKLTIKFHIKIF